MTELTRRLRGAARILTGGQESLPPSVSGDWEANFLRTCTWFQEAGRTIQSRGIFVGCPLEYFELTSRELICVALMEGLTSASSVLEVGCGCLRSGYWFIQYLEAGKYCGIEPNSTMLDAGREFILRSLEGEKRPRFSTNDQFRFGEFGVGFDFVVAFSIWSHAAKRQIETMMEEFKRTANPGAKFVTSWLPAEPGARDYQGTTWVGRSHQSDVPGLVTHSAEWIRSAAESRGLQMTLFEGFPTMHQQWAVLTCP